MLQITPNFPNRQTEARQTQRGETQTSSAGELVLNGVALNTKGRPPPLLDYSQMWVAEVAVKDGGAGEGEMQTGEKGIMEPSPLATQRHRDYF